MANRVGDNMAVRFRVAKKSVSTLPGREDVRFTWASKRRVKCDGAS